MTALTASPTVIKPLAPMPDAPLRFVATDARQLADCQHGLIGWVESKIAELTGDLNEMEAAIQAAIDNGWTNHASLRKQANKLTKRIGFYNKIKHALQAGCVLIPNFPLNLFAVRVKDSRAFPTKAESKTSWGKRSAIRGVPDQQADDVQTGTGRYVSPRQSIATSVSKDEKGTNITRAVAVDLCDVDFPIDVASPAVMSKAAESMALKVFDEIGVARDWTERNAKGDPIVVGRIRDFTRPNKVVSFFIAWSLDPRTL